MKNLIMLTCVLTAVFFTLLVPAIAQGPTGVTWHNVGTWQMTINPTPNVTATPAGGSADYMGFLWSIGPYLTPFIVLLFSILKVRRARKKCEDALRFVIYRIILIL